MAAAREVAGYAFDLDPFQVEAIAAWDRGESVLVAAPTGSGKTLVAEYAIDAALGAGGRAFYTAPIKALSNQKFRDLGARLGIDRVGLLTGDNAINADAPVVVMTTEVLRNMIYARSDALDGLAAVVLDEVHFLQDAYRGPVWEEVIIHLPAEVRLVCLSATVSNAAELVDWISTVRGPTAAVVEERRPVRLENLYLIGDRTNDRLHFLPTLVNGRANGDAVRIDGEAVRGQRRGKTPQGRRRLYTPSRLDVVELLERRRLLPAIYFIFSRNQCDEAAASCLAAGVRLTTPDERDRIGQLVETRLAGLTDADLDVLGYSQFLAQLEAGVAAHHAGMVPPFKEAVEACFNEGLVKVVFATETLAVGINMPARSVVIDKLTKFTGDHHTFLSPGEFTQLTGRAGRRGMDDVGHAVVLWSPFVTFEQVAMLASSKTFHLNSAFRPTYNMAANLVRSYTSGQAHHLLNLSFAQYQADRNVVATERRIAQREAQLDALRGAAASPFGDLDDYRRLPRQAGHGGAERIAAALEALRPGDVVYAEKAKYVGRVAVLSVAHRKAGLRITGVTTRSGLIHLGVEDFAEPPRAIGSVTLPEVFLPAAAEFQRAVGDELKRVRTTRPGGAGDSVEDVVRHPVEADPDLDERLRAATQADRVERELRQLRQVVANRAQSVGRDFDRVLGVLGEFGYVDGWSLTDAGERLSRMFHECDLLVVECLNRGLLDGLDAATFAALVSVFVYEHRSPDDPPQPWFPGGPARRRWQAIADVSYEVQAAEEEAGIAVHRPPDPTFVAVAYAWAAGEGFAEVVEEEALSGGDFVRTTKQLIDLVRQLALLAPNPETRRTAGRAADALFRGVVSASSAVEVGA